MECVWVQSHALWLLLPARPDVARAIRAHSRIFTSIPRREEGLDIWERTLTCGHVVGQSVHHTNLHPSFSTALCPECEMTRGVVTSTKTVEASARMAEAERKHDDKVARAERELKMAERAATMARKKLNKLRVNR